MSTEHVDIVNGSAVRPPATHDPLQAPPIDSTACLPVVDSWPWRP